MYITAIIILNYNNASDTINCVESIVKHNTAAVKIIVVDNGSSDKESVNALHRYFGGRFGMRYQCIYDELTVSNTLPLLTLDISAENSGYARGNNKGITLAYRDSEVDYVMILNNDTLFIDDIIPPLVKYHGMLDNCAVISPVLLMKDGNTIDRTFARNQKSPNHFILKFISFGLCIPCLYTKFLEHQSEILVNHPEILEKEYFEVQLISGSCFLIDKNTMKSIDGFDPNTFLYYEEDILSKKIDLISKKSYVLTSARLIHLGGSTTKRYSLFATKANLDSADYYMAKYGDPNFVQKVLFRIAVWLMRTKLAVIGLWHK